MIKTGKIVKRNIGHQKIKQLIIQNFNYYSRLHMEMIQSEYINNYLENMYSKSKWYDLTINKNDLFIYNTRLSYLTVRNWFENRRKLDLILVDNQLNNMIKKFFNFQSVVLYKSKK